MHDALNRAWGALLRICSKPSRRRGWRSDGEAWRAPINEHDEIEPTETELERAYAMLCEAAPPAPGMTRENLQPLIEGSYPDGEVWIEQFGSYPELRIEGAAFVFYPAPMTPLQHVRYLKDRAEAFRLQALQSNGTPVSPIARELEERAAEIGRENSLPSAATDGWL